MAESAQHQRDFYFGEDVGRAYSSSWHNPRVSGLFL